MESTHLLRRLIEYDRWANREALASLESLGEGAERPRKIFCHVIGAQRIWLSRHTFGLSSRAGGRRRP